MRISDWSSDVCSSDLDVPAGADAGYQHVDRAVLEIGEDFLRRGELVNIDIGVILELLRHPGAGRGLDQFDRALDRALHTLFARRQVKGRAIRSEEHTSELQSLMRISYAVFCLKKTTTRDHES